MIHFKNVYSLILLFSFFLAKQSYTAPINYQPQNFDDMQFYLQTVGTGEASFMAYGHTIIRIVNLKDKIDIAVNWGMFNASDPFFLWHFASGNMLYQMGIYPHRLSVATYKREKRSVVQEKINLTASQKKQLWDRIIWQSSDDNIDFPYHYYYMNCATKVRDYFNEIFRGKISDKYLLAEGDTTLRESALVHLRHIPALHILVDLLFNYKTDFVMSPWGHMFLPAELRKYLAQLPAYDDDGTEIPDTQLLSDSTTILDFPPPAPLPFTSYHLYFGFMFILILLCGVFLKTQKPRKLKRFVLGSTLAFYGLTSFVISIILFFLWNFSSHFQTYPNYNLFLFWPTDYLFIRLGYSYMRNRRLPYSKPSFYLYCFVHLLALSALIGMNVGFQKIQDSSQVLIYMGIPAFFIWMLAMLLYRRKESKHG